MVPAEPDLQSLDTVLQVIDRAGRRGEVKHVVNLAGIERLADILLQELESRLMTRVREVLHAPGQQVVGADYGVPLCQHRVAQMRSQKARPSSDQDAHGRIVTPAKSLSKALAFIESAHRSTCEFIRALCGRIQQLHHSLALAIQHAFL